MSSMATLPAAARLRRRVGPFLVAALGTMALLHLYVWSRLVWGAALLPLPTTLLSLLFVGGFTTVAVAFGSRVSGRPVPPALAAVGFTWLGVVFLGFGVSLLSEPLRWALPDVAQASVSVGSGLGVVLVALYGLVQARSPSTPAVRAPVRGLSPALTGFRIVQLSDVHIGPTVSRGFVARMVAQANAQDPDLVVITGDLVDGRVEELAEAAAPLAGLRARHGVYFVTGNHEYYSGVEGWMAHLPTLGIRVLRNERVHITREGHGFDLVGVDDLFGSMAPGHGIDLEAALRGRDPAVPAILLAHQPTVVRQAAAMGIALQLSGHTHGGQIFPFNFLVSLVQPWMHGLHRVGDTWLYVHRGTGYWGPPIRVGAPGEVARIELTPAEAQ